MCDIVRVFNYMITLFNAGSFSLRCILLTEFKEKGGK